MENAGPRSVRSVIMNWVWLDCGGECWSQTSVYPEPDTHVDVRLPEGLTVYRDRDRNKEAWTDGGSNRQRPLQRQL